MGFDQCAVIADASRMAAIKTGVQLPGRVMYFTSGNTGAAIQSIRAYRPNLVAIDVVFAETPAGSAFADSIEQIGSSIAVRIIVRQDGKWATAPRQKSTPSEPIAATQSTVVAPQPEIVAAVPVVDIPPANTRRAPRFKVRSPLEAFVEGGRATLVNLSSHGAQIISVPSLRPNQKIKVGLADSDDTLNLIAVIAWSSFEMTASAPEPFYRVGLEFDSAAQKTIDAYRRRYCADQPLPVNSR